MTPDQTYLRCMGAFSFFFSVIFTKVSNFCDFLFISLDDIVLLKLGLLLKGKSFFCRSKFFLLRVGPFEDGVKNKKDKVSSENVPIHLIGFLSFIHLICIEDQETITKEKYSHILKTSQSKKGGCELIWGWGDFVREC